LQLPVEAKALPELRNLESIGKGGDPLSVRAAIFLVGADADIVPCALGPDHLAGIVDGLRLVGTLSCCTRYRYQHQADDRSTHARLHVSIQDSVHGCFVEWSSRFSGNAATAPPIRSHPNPRPSIPLVPQRRLRW